MTTDRRPVGPRAEDVRRQYGTEAELYAQARAATAQAMGLDADAQQWERVQEDVNHDRPEDPDGQA